MSCGILPGPVRARFRPSREWAIRPTELLLVRPVRGSADAALVERCFGVSACGNRAERSGRRNDAPLGRADRKARLLDGNGSRREASGTATFFRRAIWTHQLRACRRPPFPLWGIRFSRRGFPSRFRRRQGMSAMGLRQEAVRRASGTGVTSLHVRNLRFPASYGLSGITVTRCRRSRTVIVSSVPTAAYSG